MTRSAIIAYTKNTVQWMFGLSILAFLGMNPPGLLWYGVFIAFGLITLPVSMVIFRMMPEGGIVLARPLGWLLISFTAWILAYIKILPFSWISLSVVMAAWLGLSVYIYKTRTAWVHRKIRLHWRTAWNGEIITLFVFALMVYVRSVDPSLDSTEKPMDVLFLNALTNGTAIPPLDPWFAGEIINYHYGGYLLHSVPTQLTGLPAEYTYNLAVAILTALAASSAFVLGRALFGRCRWGGVTVACTLFLGNLASVLEMLNYGRLLLGLWEWRWGFLWKTSRVIHDNINGVPQETINEFPLFTILWGDLHPHCSNLPFVLFALCSLYAVYKGLTHSPKKNAFYLHVPLLGVTTVALAFIFPTNLFDFPIVSLVLGGVVVSSILFLSAHKSSKHISWVTVLSRALVILLPIVAYVLAAPFWLEFKSPISGPLVLWSEYHTGIGEFLLVFGLHTAATFAYLLFRAISLSPHTGKEGVWFILLIIAMVFVLLWGWQGHLVFALAPMIALLLTALWVYLSTQDLSRSDERLAENFALLLCIIGWSLIAGCEIIHLSETYASKRINTLFKFHLPAWLFFGVGLPVLVYHATRSIRGIRLKLAVLAIVGMLLLASLMTPAFLFGSLLWMKKDKPLTLNGIAYMLEERPHQYEIVQWLRENAAPDARLLELPGFAYSQDSFASTYTGRVSYIGWENHEGLWRAHNPEIAKRAAEVIQFFMHTNEEEIKVFLKQHEIDYVILKTPESNDHAGAVYQTRMQQFERMKNGTFRNVLEPVIVKTGMRHNPNMVFELYQVPDSIQEG